MDRSTAIDFDDESKPWSVPEVLGKYQLRRMLGSGASGSVYLAHDTMFDRSVAIKILHRREPHQATERERFLLEARSVVRLNHPQIVAAYDINEVDGYPYIAMEWMQGGSAQQALESRGRIPWQEATAWIMDACRAVDSAHRGGMLHRDIKPGNILLTADGRAKLGDFGLVKLRTATDSHLTLANNPVGTPSFMSPEQCRSETLDECSDIYSLGATYYALLTGEAPFRADSPLGVMFAHCSSPVPDLPPTLTDVPSACGEIIRKAMSKNPEDRFANVLDMADALAAAIDAPPLDRPRSSRTRAIRSWAVAISLALVCLLGGTYLYRTAGTPASLPAAKPVSVAPAVVDAPPAAPEDPSALVAPATDPVNPLEAEAAAPNPPPNVVPSTPFPQITVVGMYKGDVCELRMDFQSEQIAAISSNGTLSIWDPKRPGRYLRRMVIPAEERFRLYALALMPKRRWAIVGGDSEEILIWNMDDGRLVNRVRHPHEKLRTLDVSPDETKVITGGDVGWNLWDVSDPQSWRNVGSPRDGMMIVHCARFSSVQPVVAGASANGIVAVQNLNDFSRVQSAQLDGQLISLAFAKTRCELAYGVDQRSVVLGTGTPRLKSSRLHNLPSNPLCLDFSPTRRQLAVGGDDGTIMFADLDTGQRMTLTVGESTRILALQYSLDGTKLAIGTGRGRLLWAELPVDLFPPVTPKRELELDLLAVRLPPRSQLLNPLKRVQEVLSGGAEKAP